MTIAASANIPHTLINQKLGAYRPITNPQEIENLTSPIPSEFLPKPFNVLKRIRYEALVKSAYLMSEPELNIKAMQNTPKVFAATRAFGNR